MKVRNQEISVIFLKAFMITGGQKKIQAVNIQELTTGIMNIGFRSKIHIGYIKLTI